MQCSTCGKEFSSGGTFDSHSVGISDVAMGNKTVAITLCPDCARSRRKLPWFVIITLSIAFGVLGLISFFLHW
jgi:hypothetical protein